MPKLNTQALRAYDARDWTLIPLHTYDETVTKKGKTRSVGKAPRHLNWTKRPYNSASTLEACIKHNVNVGVRLTASQLVIDVDPRNGGDDGFTNLCLDLGLDDSAWPCVITGSGGLHFYLSKPADVPVLDTLKDYPGVEFKSLGRQVVAAGSIHPDTHKHYRWDDQRPFDSLSSPPFIPEKLLRFIRRPQRASTVNGGGQYDQEQIAAMLAGLDPEDYREHDRWLRLMMAVHHASNGDARSEWIEWCTSDPQYADEAEIIGRRWDSLHREKNDGVTYQTLNYELAQAGKNDLIPAGDARGDFDDEFDVETTRFGVSASSGGTPAPPDDVAPEGTYDDESYLEELNKDYAAVLDGGKLRIMREMNDPVMKRKFWARISTADFTTLHSNRRVGREDADGKLKLVPLGKAWLEWARRKTFDQVIFDPEHSHDKALNLWRGYDVQPSAKGTWDYLREMIFEAIADRNDDLNEYILNWTAWMFQNPGKQAEVALVMRGGKGTGKSTFGETIGTTIGRHAIMVSSPELITGRFNAHLQDVIFLFADEAIRPQDHVAESQLKALITERFISFEGKGRDVVFGQNNLHVLMGANSSWVIPASADERRFVVADVSTRWQRSPKFGSLKNELHKGQTKDTPGIGYERFLFDMLNRDLPADWHPRKLLVTKALVDQKLRSLSPVRQFFFNACHEGHFGEMPTLGVWPRQPIRFFADDFRESFRLFCKEANISFGASGRSNMRFLLRDVRETFPAARTNLRDPVPETSMVVRAPSDGRATSIEIPSLPDCRKQFEDEMRGRIDWPLIEDLEDFG